MSTSNQDPSTDRYENEAGTIQWMEPGFWHMQFYDNDDLPFDLFSEFLVFASECRDYKVPIIVEREYSYSAGVDVYQFAQEVLPLYLNAFAFVCYSSTTADICEYICSSYLLTLPTKIFFQLDDAISWMSEHYIGEPRVPIGP